MNIHQHAPESAAARSSPEVDKTNLESFDPAAGRKRPASEQHLPDDRGASRKFARSDNDDNSNNNINCVRSNNNVISNSSRVNLRSSEKNDGERTINLERDIDEALSSLLP
jgi:hypothetical protein